MTSTPSYARVVPFLPVLDVARSLELCERAFGLERTNLNEQEGRLVHAELAADGVVVLMLAPDGLHTPDGRAPVALGRVSQSELMVRVDDAPAALAAAVALGARSDGPVRDVPWGERHAHLTDADGYRWLLTQALEPA